MSKKFARKTTFLIEEFKPDVVYCVMLRVFENLKLYEGKIYVDLIDSMALNLTRRIDRVSLIVRWLYRTEKNRVALYEKALVNRSECCFVVSHIDYQMIGSKKVVVIPLGIDFERFRAHRVEVAEPVIAFTGNMGYRPNVEAVIWFVRECWSQIKANHPGIKLVIAGAKPDPQVRRLASNDSSIFVTGAVPSIGAVLNRVMIAIAPMQSGSGMQFKILEAMACGVPVVASTLGVGDIRALANVEILIKDTSEGFIDAINMLVNFPDRRRDIGTGGLNYVTRNHSWDAMNSRFVEHISSGLRE